VGSSLDVCAGASVVSHAAENDYVEGVVCVAVTAKVEAVPAGAAASDLIRFGLSPALVSTWPATTLGSNARKDEQRWSDLVDQLIKLMVSLGDFL
jgi:hypothetical protein